MCPKIPEQQYTPPAAKAFLTTPDFSAFTLTEGNKIIGFKLVPKNENCPAKIFEVKKNGGENAIIDAFKKFEEAIKRFNT